MWQDELPASYVTDPRKITLSARELGIDGHRLAELLRRDYAIDVEMSAQGYILAIVNSGHDAHDISRMEKALEDIKKKWREVRCQKSTDVSGLLETIYRPGERPWQPAVSPRRAFFSKRENVRLEDANGRLSVSSIVPYPPGIPIVFPGAELNKEAILAITELYESGLKCTGVLSKGDELYVEVIAAHNT